MNKNIEIINNNIYTFNDNSLLYLRCKLNLQKNDIFIIDPNIKVDGTIYIIVDGKIHKNIKNMIENSPIINNKIVIYDHFGNRLHILEKDRTSNKLGNISIKTKTSPTLSNIIIPEHTEDDIVLVLSSSHFSENITDKDIKSKGIEKDLSELKSTDNVIYFLDNFLFDNHFKNNYSEDILCNFEGNNEETIECNKVICKYSNNGQNVIEYYFGKAVNINENNIHTIINIPSCKVIDINSNIISGSSIDFTIRTNGLELVANKNSEFQLLAFIENKKDANVTLKIDDETFNTSKMTIKEFPGLDFEYILKLIKIFSLVNHSFFDTLNIESLTHEEKLFMFDFIFDKISISSSSENISTKFFLNTVKIMLLKLKSKIKIKSVFNCQSRTNTFLDLDDYNNSTNYPQNYPSCQRQYSVPFGNN